MNCDGGEKVNRNERPLVLKNTRSKIDFSKMALLGTLLFIFMGLFTVVSGQVSFRTISFSVKLMDTQDDALDNSKVCVWYHSKNCGCWRSRSMYVERPHVRNQFYEIDTDSIAIFKLGYAPLKVAVQPIPLDINLGVLELHRNWFGKVMTVNVSGNSISILAKYKPKFSFNLIECPTTCYDFKYGMGCYTAQNEVNDWQFASLSNISSAFLRRCIKKDTLTLVIKHERRPLERDHFLLSYYSIQAIKGCKRWKKKRLEKRFMEKCLELDVVQIVPFSIPFMDFEEAFNEDFEGIFIIEILKK